MAIPRLKQKETLFKVKYFNYKDMKQRSLHFRTEYKHMEFFKGEEGLTRKKLGY